MNERFQRIGDIWNWLPAFRAVAETEHLPTASEMIHTSKSALSRSVNQLEEYLGHTLFDRTGRSMQLNDRGERLLRAVRNAMRGVDDAVAANLDEQYRGPFRWTCSWSLSGVSVDAMRAFVDDHPEVTPQMSPVEPETVADDLLHGDLDLAVLTVQIEREGLEARFLGELPHSIYCGRDHPLYGRGDVGFDAIEGGRFAAPLPTDEGQYLDGWPPERERRVVMEFQQMAVGFRACRDQGLLAVLPDLVAQEEEGLWRLQAVAGEHRAYAIHRETLDAPGPPEELAAAIGARLEARRTDSEATS